MNSYLHRWTQHRLQVICKKYWKLETWTVPQRCKCRRVRWFSVRYGHPLSDRFETWEIDVHLCAGLNMSLDPEGACWSKNGKPTNAQLSLEISLAVKLAPNRAYIAIHWESVCVDQTIKRCAGFEGSSHSQLKTRDYLGAHARQAVLVSGFSL